MAENSLNIQSLERSKGIARKAAESLKDAMTRDGVIDQSRIEDLALKALLIVKRNIDIEGPLESTVICSASTILSGHPNCRRTVITVIRRTLTEIAYFYGIQINENRFDTSSRFDGPITNQP
jgi:hypothetical protein